MAGFAFNFDIEDQLPFSTASLKFRSSMGSFRDENHPPQMMTGKEAYRRIKDKVAGRGKSTMLEAMWPADQLKPFFDIDYTPPTPPTSTQLEEYLQNSVIKPLVKVFDFNPEQLAIASSHGMKNGSFKVSFRVFVQNARVTARDMARVVQQLPANFDKTVYPVTAERLLRCVGCIKGKGDSRLLIPYDSTRPYSHYLVQLISGTEEPLDVAAICKDIPTPKKPKRPTQPRVYNLPQWLPEDAVDASKLALANVGMRNGYEFGSQRGNLVIFKTTSPRQCVYSPAPHTSNAFCCELRRNGTIVYKCHAGACQGKQRVIGNWLTDISMLTDSNRLTITQRLSFDPSVTATVLSFLRSQDPNPENRTKQHMLEGYPQVRAFVVAYISRFFVQVQCATPETVQLWYDEDGHPIRFERRRKKETQEVLANAGENAHPMWETNEHRFVYAGFTSHPDRVATADSFPNLLNLATGVRPFANLPIVKPTAEEMDTLVQPWLDHMLEFFAADQQHLADYMWNWIAIQLQRPGYKTDVCLIMRGPQGLGKSMVSPSKYTSIIAWPTLYHNTSKTLYVHSIMYLWCLSSVLYIACGGAN